MDRKLLQYLVEYLVKESEAHGCALPPAAADAAHDGLASTSADELWLAFRSLVNVRPPWPAPAEFLAAQNELLQGLIAEAGVATLADTTPSPTDPRLRLWRGDITTLAVDAIVNAANSGMTGCWAPLHYCIDNAIHTFAGVQLREACANLMAAQGHPEPTAQAKVTDGYNLPARYVIHTVGPIADGRPTATHRRRPDRERARHVGGRAPARRVLPLLPGARRAAWRAECRLLLHLHGRVRLPPG